MSSLMLFKCLCPAVFQIMSFLFCSDHVFFDVVQMFMPRCFFRSCLFLFCSDHVLYDVVQMLILCCCLNHVLSDVVQMLMPCCCSNHVLSDVVQMLMLCCCSLRSCPLWWCSDVYMPCCFFRSCLFFILFRSCPLWCCSDAHALLLFTQIMSSLMLFRCLCHAFIQIMSPKLFRWLYYYLWGCSDYQRPSRGED